MISTLLSAPALSVGAAITTLLGLAGLIVAAIYLAYLARLETDKKQLELLPEKDRGKHLDEYLTRYGLTAKEMSEQSKYELLKSEMHLRFRKQLVYAVLGAIVFLTCFIIIANRTKQQPPPQERVRTEGDKIVIDYQQKILALRGDYESRAINPSALQRVQTEGVRLAGFIANVDDSALNPSRRVIKEEYGGWALLLVARTYPLDAPERKQYTEQALERFDRAIEKMRGIEHDFHNGVKYADQDYEWMNGPDADWQRTLFLKAMAMAVLGQAGGPVTKDQVRAQLNEVSAEYKKEFPPQNNEELRWALF